MKIEHHEKINELMGKITDVGRELLGIQREIRNLQDDCGSIVEYAELLDVYISVVDTELARGVVFEKLTNMVTKED